MTRMHADSTFTGWADEKTAVAEVDAASSAVFQGCAFTGNSGSGGALVGTSRVVDFMQCTIVVQDCAFDRDASDTIFYWQDSAGMGVLYADADLIVATSFNAFGAPERLDAALPLREFDAAASAPVLQAGDNPLLLRQAPLAGPDDPENVCYALTHFVSVACACMIRPDVSCWDTPAMAQFSGRLGMPVAWLLVGGCCEAHCGWGCSAFAFDPFTLL